MSAICHLQSAGLPAFLSRLAGGARVLAPVERPAVKRSVVFAPWSEGMPFTLDKATVPAKEAVLPACETLFTFRQTKDGETPDKPILALEAVPKAEPTVVFACRPCDARGYAVLDRPYLHGPFADPYYKARRENLTVLSLTCSKGCDTCFCHWTGGGPSSPEGSDVLMTEIEGGFVLQGITPKGDELLAASGLPDGKDAFPSAEAARKAAWGSLAKAPNLKDAPARLAERFTDTAFWERQTERCLSCGACTYFCPTCYCFGITDEGDPQNPQGGRRLRSWDSCMSPLFTLEASGHNPRPSKALRMRNRVSHKYSTYPGNWGSFSCSGCGRCIANCPVCLDIRAIVLAACQDPKAS
jgi:ferredoxin